MTNNIDNTNVKDTMDNVKDDRPEGPGEGIESTSGEEGDDWLDGVEGDACNLDEDCDSCQ